ncbi:MAG TPA: hypothetical protein DHI91_00665 [Candidatus Portnoybacteria bacterium]|nr:hypothetical protein [Candidatus Portnoybacteria bacterium]
MKEMGGQKKGGYDEYNDLQLMAIIIGCKEGGNNELLERAQKALSLKADNEQIVIQGDTGQTD